MYKFTLVRKETSDEGTFGILYLDDIQFCVTAELPIDHDNDGVLNEKGREAILPDTYTVNHRFSYESGKYKYNHYILENVKDRSYILIHIGNYAGDKTDGYKTDVEGCILLGTGFNRINGQKVVTNSKVAFTEFYKIVGQNSFILEIKEDFKEN